MKEKDITPPNTADWMEKSAEKLVSYFSWRQPYRGDEGLAKEAALWALRQTQKQPEELAVLLLETVNERNALQKRIRAISAIATNSDFVEDATVESVEWAFGRKLRTAPSTVSKS